MHAVLAKLFLPTFPKHPCLRQRFGAKLFRCKQRQLRACLAQLPQRRCQALRATAVYAAEVGLALRDSRQATIEGRPSGIRNDLGR